MVGRCLRQTFHDEMEVLMNAVIYVHHVNKNSYEEALSLSFRWTHCLMPKVLCRWLVILWSLRAIYLVWSSSMKLSVMDWMFGFLPNSYVETPTLSVTAFVNEALTQVIKVKWGHKGGPESNTTVLLRRERDTRNACTQTKGQVRTQREDDHLQAKNRETKLMTPWSWAPSLQNCEK